MALGALMTVTSGSVGADEIRLAGVQYLGDLPTVVADHEQLFARQGLDVTVGFNLSGRQNLEALRAGETDFALMALTPLVLDRLADATPGGADDPVILASLVHSIRLNHVVTFAGSGIETPRDLRGRTVALPGGTNAEFVWEVFSRVHGLDPAASVIRDMPVHRIPDALAAGAVAAAVVWEPWTTRLGERLGARLRTLPGANHYTAKWVLVTSRRTVAEAPQRCASMLAAYRRAMDLIRRAPDHAIRTFAARMDFPPGSLRTHWAAVDYDLSLDWSLITALQQQLDWARRAGHGAGEVDVLSLIAPGPLRAVLPEAVGVPRGPAG